MNSAVDRYGVASFLPPCCPERDSIRREKDDNRYEGNEQERIILAHMPLVRYIAQRIAAYMPPIVDVEDLIQVGVIGLMDAMEKYNPTRSNLFKSYAEFRIRGAMLDELRELDWVPRSVRKKERTLESVREELAHSLGRCATDGEVVAFLGIDLEEFHSWNRQVAGVSCLSLDWLGSHADTSELLDVIPDEAVVGPFEELAAREVRQIFARAADDLPSQEKIVVSLYYNEELTMKEIGRVLDVTEARISQIHTKAISHLRSMAVLLLNDDRAEHTNDKHEKEQVMSESNGNGLTMRPDSIGRDNETGMTVPFEECLITVATASRNDTHTPVPNQSSRFIDTVWHRSGERRAQTILPELRWAIQTREIEPTMSGVQGKFHVSSQAAMIALQHLEDEGILSKKTGKTRSRTLLVPITSDPSSAPGVDDETAAIPGAFQQHVPFDAQSGVVSSPFFAPGVITTSCPEGPLPLFVVESSLREFAGFFEVNVPMRRLLTSAAQYMTELGRIREIMSKISA